MAGEWNGFEDGDVKLNFNGAIFNVHRAVMALASPMLNTMLNGPFADSKRDTIVLHGDDPEIARFCIELIYSMRAESGPDWTSIGNRVRSDPGAFDAFVDKYDLRGVRSLIAHVLRMEEDVLRMEEDVLRMEEKNKKLNKTIHDGLQRVKQLQAEVSNLKRRSECALAKQGRADISTYELETAIRARRKEKKEKSSRKGDYRRNG